MRYHIALLRLTFSDWLPNQMRIASEMHHKKSFLKEKKCTAQKLRTSSSGPSIAP